MVNRGVMFDDVVAFGFVFDAWCPIVLELFLTDFVSKPVKLHVYGF
jgi:hypothetical protein